MGWSVNSPVAGPLEYDSHFGGLPWFPRGRLQAGIPTIWFVCGPQCWCPNQKPDLNALACSYHTMSGIFGQNLHPDASSDTMDTARSSTTARFSNLCEWILFPPEMDRSNSFMTLAQE